MSINVWLLHLFGSWENWLKQILNRTKILNYPYYIKIQLPINTNQWLKGIPAFRVVGGRDIGLWNHPSSPIKFLPFSQETNRAWDTASNHLHTIPALSHLSSHWPNAPLLHASLSSICWIFLCMKFLELIFLFDFETWAFEVSYTKPFTLEI